MSDKPKKDEKEKKPDAAAEKGAEGHGDAAKKKGGIGALLTKLPVLLGGVMVIEAGVLFGAFKMLGSAPPAAQGATLAGKEGEHGLDADDGPVEEPKSADGKEAKPEKGAPEPPKLTKKGKYALPVIEFRAPNKVSGRMLLYDVSIEVQVLGINYHEVEEKLKARKALISDRIRTIIAQTDPEKLNGQAEPGLETLKRQVKMQLEEIIGGHDLVEEVLVPRCIPFRADF